MKIAPVNLVVRCPRPPFIDDLVSEWSNPSFGPSEWNAHIMIATIGKMKTQVSFKRSKSEQSLEGAKKLYIFIALRWLDQIVRNIPVSFDGLSSLPFTSFPSSDVQKTSKRTTMPLIFTYFLWWCIFIGLFILYFNK